MDYSLIGSLALLILIISNHDILLHRSDRTGPRAKHVYFVFLLCVIVYYLTDVLWGVFSGLSLYTALYIDTVIYFVAMAGGILMWTAYVFVYLEEENVYKTILRYAGIVFFIFASALIVLNFFFPLVFSIDRNGNYQAEPMRYSLLGFQVLMFLLTSLYETYVTRRTAGREKRRHLTICLFGLIMAAAITVQMYLPLEPVYSIGYMLGTCLLHTFVIDDEKEEYRSDLEASLSREKKQLDDLNAAWDLAYTDTLTGVKSKLAYSEKAAKINEAIANGTTQGFAVVSFDLNKLKYINDTLGHEVGDSYIKEACRLICEIFQHSPVFRTGGDEFVTVLEGSDYDRRKELMAAFDSRIDENRRRGQVVVAAGMEEYMPGRDNSIERVFKRADSNMYDRKEALKRE